MLQETYLKFKKNILPKIKKMEPDFQEPIIEYCEPEQVLDICSYNHYPVIDKANEGQNEPSNDNDIYDTSELENEFEYGIYEDVFKTEEFMAELKCIDEAKQENKKLRNIRFQNFPLEEFSEAGKVANEGDPQLKAAVDNELYELEKHAIQIDINNNTDKNTSNNTDDNASNNNTDDITHQNADEGTSTDTVSHVHKQVDGETLHPENDHTNLHKIVYGPTYVPFKEEDQKIL